MSNLRLIPLFLALCWPPAAYAGVMSDDLPAGTVWYLHADLQQMRSTDSGAGLYGWLEDEIFVEIHEEVGIDISKEVDSITAFSGSPKGTIFLIDGPIRSETEEQLVSMGRTAADIEERAHKGRAYFRVADDEGEHHRRRDKGEMMADLQDGAFISFALNNKVLITGREEQMHELLESNGKVAGADSHNGALFVLTADKTFVQAGVDTGSFSADDDDDWDSTIIRNTEQAALMISDFNGMIAIEAQLVSSEPEMAQSIGGIATGLLSLQSFNSELDPEVKSLLANTKVDVSGSVLTIATVIAPHMVSVIFDN